MSNRWYVFLLLFLLSLVWLPDKVSLGWAPKGLASWPGSWLTDDVVSGKLKNTKISTTKHCGC